MIPICGKTFLCFQPSSERKWVWHTGDQATNLLEQTIYQDLSGHEDPWRRNNTFYHPWPERWVAAFIDSWWAIPAHLSGPWKSLLGSQGSLQHNCNREGFNVESYLHNRPKTRIGIIGNNERDCFSCDSRIGFGSGGNPGNTNTCGIEAQSAPDNGDRHIKAMGYILIQWHYLFTCEARIIDRSRFFLASLSFLKRLFTAVFIIL